MTDSRPSAERPDPRGIMLAHTLRKAPIFSGIRPEALETLAEGCSLRSVEKGGYLFHAGTAADGFFVVHTGAVNVHRVTEDGREQVIRVFYPGESLGEVVIAGNHAYPASAKATENSQVILVPTAFFRARIKADPDLALCILASMSQHLRFLVETIEDLKLKQAESRVAQWLLRQMRSAGSDPDGVPALDLPLAKHLLASQLGITSETLSRVFARLRGAELLEVEGKHLRFPDPAGLQAFLESTGG